MVHAIRHASRPHPDANRIAGISVAIAFNATLLLILLVPMSAPVPGAIEDPVVYPVLPDLKRPDPPPPMPVPVIRPQTPRPQAATQPQSVTPPVDQVVVDQGSLPADPGLETPATATPNAMPANAGPLPGVRLEYADAPAPPYPRDALRDGLQGTVLLQVLVDTDGRPLDVQIQRSSGHRQLDDAARRHVLKRWTFRPAMQDGRAVQAYGLVPIAFSLDR